jgi:hypothetical protein
VKCRTSGGELERSHKLRLYRHYMGVDKRNFGRFAALRVTSTA